MLLDLFRRRLARTLSFRMGLLLTLCAGLSAVFVMSAMLAIAWWTADTRAREDASADLRTMSYALQAQVAFLDEDGIREAMSVLRRKQRVKGAWIYDTAGGMLYAWGEMDPVAPGANAGNLASGWLKLSEPIVAGTPAELVGTVAIHVDLGESVRVLQYQIAAAFGATLIGLLLSLAISRRLARRISVPVMQLSGAASAIARDQNYERRLPPAGADELGAAVTAFNHMIDEVQRRGEALASLNTELQHQATEAMAARRMAESASLAKTRFLANMSHELRSPLNGVIGAAQLLQAQGSDPGRRAELVEIIRTSGTNLLGLIESVLDLARIEAGAVEVSGEDFNVVECMDSAAMSSAAQAAAKGLHLACIVPPGLPAWRHGDPLRLRQLLMNLLGNAVKFTQRGEVTLELSQGNSPGELCFHVRDTGVGIEAEALQMVFEPFQQADASTTRRFGGTGLGLTICRDLATLMGGRVDVQSEPGQGTCFTLVLPLPLAKVVVDEPQPLGLRVAWCEPHEPSAKALAGLFNRLGCQAQRCEDAASLRTFMAQPDALGRSPWLFVAADAAAGRALLAEAAPWLDMKRVVLMGAEGGGPDAHARDVAGLPRGLVRPVLRTAVVSRLAAVRARAPGAPDAGHAAKRHARVLVAEDDLINQTVVRSMLEHVGYTCQLVADGHAALDLLRHTAVDLVLMDWQMPGMDGLETTRQLRAGLAGELNRQVPVVALTANAFAEDRSACIAAGMDDFLTKPVLAANLIECADRWTARRSGSAALKVAAPPEPTLPSAAVPSAPREPLVRIGVEALQMLSQPLFDPSVLAALPMVADGSDPDCVANLLAMFTDGALRLVDTVAQASEREDHPGLRRALHTLKSTAGQVGAPALAAAASMLEAQARAGQFLDAGTIAVLRTLLADTVSAMQPTHDQGEPMLVDQRST
jgi:two-component system sensor histidine kinase BarA